MKKLFLIMLVALLAFQLMANGSGESGAAAPKRLTFATGSSGGNFYVVGAGLANTITNLFPDRFIVTGEETGGGSANLVLIENGDADFGIAMASSIEQGLSGQLTSGKPMENIRGFLPLYPSYLTIYALDSNPVKTLEDFNGKTVGFGSKGMAMDKIFRELLPKMNINPANIFNDGHGATATAVSQGNIDAALLFSLPPFPAIAELEASTPLHFIGLTKEQQEFLISQKPFYTAAKMPKGAYKGVTEEYDTVTEWNFAVCSAKLSEQDVYDIAKTLFENNPALVQVYKGLTNVTPENEVYFNVKLHPGVIKYLDEKGVKIPDSLR
ncbi:MAG: TAXI family TRAP transporter solute-binding subunit [Sphaerochaetaceae bacterium]|nr:TAXI family TRAP transporter solute-binding subunit [Sphaerochaetaceae bacterium]